MQDLTGIVVVSSLTLAAVLGFVAHRASVCTVKAVAEVVSTGQGYMFLSFLKTVLWVIAITIPFVWWLPEAHGGQRSWGISATVLLGGFLFGMGAALNKGCAFSTLSRLGDGQLAMLVTLAGFCSGIYVTTQLPDGYTSPHTILLEPALTTSNTWTIGLVGALWIWVMWEGSRLWRSRRENTPWWQLVGAHRYRLSTAAAVLGIASGILYALHGAWAYSGTISAEIHHVAAGGPEPSTMLVSFPAGLMMGFGAALVPGSNDVLILHAIPGLSPHALPAYAAMVIGIALPLVLLRVIQGTPMGVDCGGDICRSGIERDQTD